MSKYSPLKELLLTRVRQFFREPETIFWVYCFPLVLMTVLGTAFKGQGDAPISVRVYAESDTEYDRIAASLQVDGIRLTRASLEDVERSTGQFDFDLTLVQRAASSEKSEAEEHAGTIEFQYDKSRIESQLAHLRVNDLIQRHAGRTDRIGTKVALYTQPGARYIDWLIPGLMGLNIMGGGLWGIGFVAVDMRIRRLLKRFRATPMKRSHFLFSLIGGRLLFLIPEMTTIILVGHFAFGLRVTGDLLSLFITGFIGASTFASIGMLLASRAQKLETISGLMNLTMIPMWLLSGVFFSTQRFPEVVQPVIQALPLTQLNHMLRGIILEGHSIFDEWIALLILAAWGCLTLPLALKWFRWQ